MSILSTEQVIERMRRTRLLNVVPENLELNCEGDRVSHSPDENFEEVYFRNLNEAFGLKIIEVSVDSMNEERERADRKKAEKIADMWIDEAKEVRWQEIGKEQIIMSAQLYLATVKMMEENSCDAVTMSIGPVLKIGKMPVRPPLAEMELAKSNIVTSCESLIDCLTTQLLGFYMTGNLSFVGDVLSASWLKREPVEGTFAVGHCYAPINPYGDDRRVPYIIRNHAITPSTVGILVELPLGETVTVAKLNVYGKKISIFTGRSVDGRSLYENFDDIACRTKVVVKTESEKVMKNYNRETFGVHRVVFFADISKELKDLAASIGFEVIEEDA